jgi:hypothetical protein
MMRRMSVGSLWARWGAVGMAAMALGLGCGDDETGGNDTDTSDVPLFDTNGNFDTDVGDTTDTTIVDTLDATNTDARDTRDTLDTNPPDLVPDLEPPTVVSTSPAAGAENVALPLEITIVFSEPLFVTTIAPQSIKLIDWLGKEVPGTPTVQADKKTVVWKPTTNNQQLASAYTIRVVGNIIADPVGNKLVNTLEYTFTTVSYPNQGAYSAVAARYAPSIYSSVEGRDGAQFQVPTKVDGDGDWDLSNNRTWITSGATQLLPAVYYSVSETYTHWYITYVYYFAYVNHPDAAFFTGNGSAGVLVVVEKARGEQAERPIAAYTYWKEGNAEENFAFATEESGIVGSGSADDWGLKAVQAEATLFPGGRFESYVTAKRHRSCNWNWNQGGFLPACEVGNAVKNGDKLVFKYADGVPTSVVKKNNAWPNNMSEVEGTPESFSYALVPIWTTLWTRRFDTSPSGLFDATTFKYTADSERPGSSLELTTKFVQSVAAADLSAYGKPVWSWGWNPSVSSGNELVDAIKRGQFAIDPAWYVWERHHRANRPNSLVDYVPATGAGFAVSYCFNGYANIDVRTIDPKCAP